MSDYGMEASPQGMPVGYSVIIEWENMRLAETARAREMLGRLSAQIRNLQSRGLVGEVILVRDAEELVTTDGLDRFLQESFPRSEAMAVRTIEMSSELYYEKKNIGARAAAGPIIIFLDSDVTPEQRWFGHSFGHSRGQFRFLAFLPLWARNIFLQSQNLSLNVYNDVVVTVC